MAVLVKTLKCERCGHEWYPRNPQPPKVCPECKRTDWQSKLKNGRKEASND